MDHTHAIKACNITFLTWYSVWMEGVGSQENIRAEFVKGKDILSSQIAVQ